MDIQLTIFNSILLIGIATELSSHQEHQSADMFDVPDLESNNQRYLLPSS